MNVFVTGGSGFIGTHLVRRLVQHGARVHCLVRPGSALADDLRGEVEVLSGSLDDLPEHRARLAQCVVVYHLAAKARIAGRGGFAADNVAGTRSLLRALEGSRALRRLVFTSSIGAVDRGPADECRTPLDESAAPHPLTEYGRSKLECERLIAAAGLPATIVRPTWVYGPGMPADSHMRVFARLIRRGALAVRFDWPGLVSTIYVADLVRALMLLAEDDRACGQTYFAAEPEPVALGALLRDLGRGLGRAAGSVRPPGALVGLLRTLRPRLPLAAQNLCSHVLWADAAKLAALGFQSEMDRPTGLLRTLRWDAAQAARARDDSPGQTVVTGAAGGIGGALARQLYVRGHDLILIDSDAAGLREVAAQTEAEPVAADLTHPDELRALGERLAGRSIGWLLNVAGAGARGPASDLGVEAQQRLIDLNCRAVLALSVLALGQFRRRGRGVLVNVASSAAFQPLAYMAVYAATKAFVLHLTEALWAEARDLPGVRVLVVSPAGTATGFQRAAGVRANPREKLLDPSHVAARIIRAAETRSGSVIIGRSAWLMFLASRVPLRNAVAGFWARMMARLR